MNPKRNREIVIMGYRTEWPVEFERIRDWLAGALGKAALRIDHIGSTAVPGLAAKDIIDAQVTVAALDVSVLDPAFARIGCARALDIDRDHVPPTASNGDGWRKLYYRPPATLRPTHLHVRRAGSANGRYALLFRDYLRAHPLAASAYAQVKRALVGHDSFNVDFYYDVKDPVCDSIMAGAEDWATATGWRLDYYS